MSTSVTIEQPAGAVIVSESADRVIAEIRRAPEAWGTCPECTTQPHCSAEQWCSKQDVEDLDDLVAVRAALHREWVPVYGAPPVRACLVADLLAALSAEQAGGLR